MDQEQEINHLIMDLDFNSQPLKHTNKTFVLLPHTYLQYQDTIENLVSLQDTKKQTQKLTHKLLNTKTKYDNLVSAKMMTTDTKVAGLDAKVASLQMA
jgi:hypothetical protein